MIHLLLTRLTRWWPQRDPDEAVRAWSNEDSNWHSSSFELARGLEVIELRVAPSSVFADTLPEFHPPKA
mgnify:CR=1 FL=1